MSPFRRSPRSAEQPQHPHDPGPPTPPAPPPPAPPAPRPGHRQNGPSRAIHSDGAVPAVTSRFAGIQSSPNAPANAPASTTSATVTSTATNAATASPVPHGIGPGGSGASVGRGGASTRIDSTSPDTGSTNSTGLPRTS